VLFADRSGSEEYHVEACGSCLCII
jgi:hypothetical protein